MHTKIKELFENYERLLGSEVTVGGWIKTLRESKNFAFAEINDGTFFKSVQLVLNSELDNYDELVKLGAGAAIIAQAQVVESPGEKQKFELLAKSVTIEGVSPADYPLQKKRHTLEYLRTIAHLRPRANTFLAVFRVRSLASFAIHQFFSERGFVYVHTPILTGSDCEGAGEMFKINNSEDFFGKIMSLTVSGQLSGETFAMAFRDIYTFGPTFRAENSNTPRHAAEFWMVEPEMAFCDLTGNMDVAEAMLKYIIKYVLENAPGEMAFFDSFVDKGIIDRLTALTKADFARITYTEAIDILAAADAAFEYPVNWGMDLQTEHERYLSETVFKRPVFVTDYPKDIKAFYMRLNDDGKTVAAMDLLVPGVGELMGGSQREERYDVLKNRITEMGMDPDDYWWYLDLRKYGAARHAGFGLGFERCIMYLTGMANIRDVIPFPRTVRNAEF